MASRRMAVKTSKQEAANRKVGRMLTGNAKHQRNQVAKKEAAAKKKPMATKVPGKMGPSRRSVEKTPKTRKTDRPADPNKPQTKEQRTAKLHKHFNQMLSARNRHFQGKK